jgi:uncharacterized membrane protein YcjF (UPF0283 family)
MRPLPSCHAARKTRHADDAERWIPSAVETTTKEFVLMATHSATGAEAQRSGALNRATRRLATETKQAFKTTEFWAMVALVVAILVSAALIKGGDNGTDQFIARQAWLYVAILGAGYFISRGLAKSGSREPYSDEPDDRQ